MIRWGQIYILESLLSFVPTSTMDAEQLAERVSVRLSHANSAVVLTTIKVILYLMNYMEDEVFIRSLERKMGPPLGKLGIMVREMTRADWQSHSSRPAQRSSMLDFVTSF
jgi:vesicle coat complex subunit